MGARPMEEVPDTKGLACVGSRRTTEARDGLHANVENPISVLVLGESSIAFRTPM